MSSAKDSRFFLLGTSPTILDKVIHTSKLPTYRQVILSFLAHHDELLKPNNKIIRDASKLTADIVAEIYSKANIPTVAHHKICEKIENYYKTLQSLQKIPKEVRDKPGKSSEKIKKFKEDIGNTFAFWPRNALELITIEEDRQFLINMMGPRSASFGGSDKKFATTQHKVAERKASKEERILKEEERRACASDSLTSTVDDHSDDTQVI